MLTRTHAHKHSSTQMGRRVAVICVRKRLECISVAEASCLIWSEARRYWQQLQGQWGGWARAWEGGAFWNTGEVADGPICSWEARLKAAGKLDSTQELWEKMTWVQLHSFVPFFKWIWSKNISLPLYTANDRMKLTLVKRCLTLVLS